MNYKRILQVASIIVAAFLIVLLIILWCNNSVIPSMSDKQSNSSESTTEQQTDATDVPSLIIDKVTAGAGQTVEVKIRVVNNPGIAGALIRFDLDAGLQLMNATPGEAFSFLDYTPPGKFENTCKFSWDSEFGMAVEDGTILTLTLKTPETANPGDMFNIHCAYNIGDIYNEELNDVDLEINSGSITIQ